jgi:hypothetical protein
VARRRGPRTAPGLVSRAVVRERIELEAEEVAGLIRGAGLLELRADTPADVRTRSLEVARTAIDALCGLVQRHGPDGAWDALELLTPRELLAISVLMADELQRADVDLRLPG